MWSLKFNRYSSKKERPSGATARFCSLEAI